MSEKEIAEKLAFVNFNLECEGFTPTEKNNRIGKAILSGEITGDEAVKRIVKEHGFKIS